MSEQTNEVAVTKPGKHKVLLIYAGGRLDSKEKPVALWLVATDLDNDGESFPSPFNDDYEKRQRLYGTKTGKHCFAGQLYEFDEEDGTSSIFPASKRHIGQWENDADRATWKAADMATRATLDAMKKCKGDNLLGELDNIKKAYSRLGHLQRAHLLAKIVAYIVRGS